MSAAYEALSDEMRARIEGLSAHHSLIYSSAEGRVHPEGRGKRIYGVRSRSERRAPTPLVKVHPETGRKTATHRPPRTRDSGLSEESEELLDDLVEFACQPPHLSSNGRPATLFFGQ